MDFERGLKYCAELEARFMDQRPIEAEYSRFCYCRDNCAFKIANGKGACSIAERFEAVIEYLKGEGLEYKPGKTATGKHKVKYLVRFEDKDGNGVNYLSIGHAISSVEYDMAKYR